MSAPAVAIPHESGAMSESDAVERILARSRSDQAPAPSDEDPDEPAAELAEAETDTEVPIDEPQIEGGEFDDDEPMQTSADPVVKFDDGTELALSEVKRGFLRQQDYTRKTQETAELRKSVETERATLNDQRRQAAENIEPLIQAALAIVNNPATQQELAQLREIDPGAYAVKVMDLQAKQNQMAQLQAQQRALREQSEREAAETFQRERAQTAQQSRATLMETIPAAKKDFDSWYKGLGKWVLDQGIAAEAWDNEVDHRIILMAYKAKQYDEATRKAPATKDQLRKAPQPMRPGTARPPGYAQSRELKEATERAYKSGKPEDMVAVQLLKQKQQNARR